MWTRESRGRMARIAGKTKRYPSDLTDEEWERIEPLLPQVARRGRKPRVDLREILNAIRYMARSAGGWRMRRGADDGPRAGRTRGKPDGGGDRQPDDQGPGGRARGYDANKKIVDRKRHIAV